MSSILIALITVFHCGTFDVELGPTTRFTEVSNYDDGIEFKVSHREVFSFKCRDKLVIVLPPWGEITVRDYRK